MIHQTQFKITFDRIRDPEQVTKYSIRNNVGKVLAKGFYLYLFGFRLGFHLDTKTMRLK